MPLPHNIETCYWHPDDAADVLASHGTGPTEPGWYWAPLEDSEDLHGPFATKADAETDAARPMLMDGRDDNDPPHTLGPKDALRLAARIVAAWGSDDVPYDIQHLDTDEIADLVGALSTLAVNAPTDW